MFATQRVITKASLIAVLLWLTGCNNNNNDDPPLTYREIGEEFKQYVLFKPGSRWVYEHQASSRLDTVIVLDVDTFNWLYGTDLDPQYRFRYEAFKTYFSGNRIGLTSSECSPGSNVEQQGEMTEIWRMFFGSRYNIIFDPKLETGLTVDHGRTQGYYTNVQKNIELELGGKIYNNVWLTTVTDYFFPDSTLYFEYAIARNYGIIRFKRIAGSLQDEWILHDSNLQQ